MNGYHVHTPLNLIEEIVLFALVALLMIFVTLGWLIFPALIFTSWRPIGIIGTVGWCASIAFCIAFEVKERVVRALQSRG